LELGGILKKQLDIIHVCDDIYTIDWLSAAQPKGKYYEAMDQPVHRL